MSGREPLPELKLENSLIGMSGDYTTNESQSIQLTTPPHKLTLDEHTFPYVDDNHSSVQSNGPVIKINKKKRNIALSGFANTSATDDVLLLYGLYHH